MQYTFNKQTLFYDYFPHLPALRMKESFGLNYFEQFVIRNEIQKLVTAAYENLVDQHDLRHFDVYGEIGEQFDDNFLTISCPAWKSRTSKRTPTS